ncbi:MAG TPA: 3,4-dihydroxy-2-butanone-4-phosphate synthase [Candidatus Thermoplasmatota archaeon]|nr:3,4-dihydroxy-2-butanone-4-phosphate synthase [Candidatus Thermoplasmatota archaeon]
MAPSNGALGDALSALREGRFVLVYDSDNRERETDFLIPASAVRPEHVRTMRKDGGGLVFLAVDHSIHERLGLPYLQDLFAENSAKHPVFGHLVANDITYDARSAFSVWINHRKTFTGITDDDRALTARRFAEVAAEVMQLQNGHALELFGAEFRSPGHVPICSASAEPLRSRFGHSELAVALMRMAGVTPVALGCEMLGDHGKALSKDSARAYASAHGLPFLEGATIVEAWRSRQWSA